MRSAPSYPLIGRDFMGPLGRLARGVASPRCDAQGSTAFVLRLDKDQTRVHDAH
jgi:hypothetical protein